MSDTTSISYELQVLDPARKWNVILTSDDVDVVQRALTDLLVKAPDGTYNDRLRIVEAVTTVRRTIFENVRSIGR